MGTHEATTSDRVPSAGDSRWIVAFDRHVLWRMVRPRVLDVALESECAYVEPPRMDGDVVRAVLRDPESGSSQRVDLARVADDVIDGTNVSAVLRGDCSRCVPMFGPCHHVVVLALDVASSATLREALASGASTEEFADEARTRRQETHREVTFETSLATWLAPTQAGARIEIAAHPARVRDVLVGAQYGERAVDPAASCVVVAVRPRGQKKLLGAREIVAGANFARRDREVLGHTRERGSGRRATIASSVDASLLLEAMRTHGGVFGEGHKALLDFRAGFARPQIRFGTDGTSGPRAEDALSAHWKFDDGRPPVPFERAHFFPGPFPFVWTEAGAIYRVAKDVDTDFASELAKTPVLWVPPGRLRDAGSRLHRATHGRGVELPDHEAFGLPPLETPRIVLRLAGEPLSLRGELVAVYRAHEIDLGDDVDAWDPSVDAVRDLPCERRGRAAVERA
ncbi:MAG: hypothetical protein U0169_21845 [Polyangiaceae bacterium]